MNDGKKVDRAPVSLVSRWRETEFLVDAFYFDEISPLCLVRDAFIIEAVSISSLIHQ